MTISEERFNSPVDLSGRRSVDRGERPIIHNQVVRIRRRISASATSTVLWIAADLFLAAMESMLSSSPGRICLLPLVSGRRSICGEIPMASQGEDRGGWRFAAGHSLLFQL
ncbi:hypothetical protein HPP92_027003 [Vanilla planifolia]|uniref:Uncharacterized protein n=1 Tax=Vanilla planifolia TaxID=51239 RepID=A0A835U565_VANPL|nr:hypothetical protein HPP92_027003 [Vanilla planifolia]KAG0469751.1 hypothetical protein HPP92_016451 [Vanilla planifolia]